MPATPTLAPSDPEPDPDASCDPEQACTITTAVFPQDMAAVQALFQEYAHSLSIDLEFQQFDEELASLPGCYAPPAGTLLLAWVQGQAVGCCALRPLPDCDHPDAAEMKRLYVRPDARSMGLGRKLAEAVLEAARMAGYHCVLLDTISDMEVARALYEDLGFVEIPPYYHNPVAGAHYLKVVL